MLLHVTLTHDIDNCPGFDDDLRNRALQAYAGLDDVATEYGVVIRDHYNAAPDHVEFIVAEAPSNMALAMFFTAVLPYKVEFESKVVTDRAAMASLMESMAPPA